MWHRSPVVFSRILLIAFATRSCSVSGILRASLRRTTTSGNSASHHWTEGMASG